MDLTGRWSLERDAVVKTVRSLLKVLANKLLLIDEYRQERIHRDTL